MNKLTFTAITIGVVAATLLLSLVADVALFWYLATR